MRLMSLIAVAAACASISGVGSARADHVPVLAVPGNTSAPVIVNGADASYAVIESDWGLYRAGHAAPVVYYPYAPYVDDWYARPYHPFTGKRPRSGRVEVIPPANRRLPTPAAPYRRSWSSDGSSVPAQTDYQTFVPPPVILAPRLRALN